MDRNAVIGFLLIFLLLLVWMYMTTPPPPEEMEEQTQEQPVEEPGEPGVEPEPGPEPDPGEPETPDLQDQGVFGTFTETDTTSLQVSSPLYDVEFTNLGGGPARFILNEHQTADGEPVQLIRDTSRSTYSLDFLSTDNHTISTNDLLFTRLTPEDEIEIGEDETAEVQYALELEDGSRILYTYELYGDTYQMDLNVTFDGAEQYISGNDYDLTWQSGLNFTEEGRDEEIRFTESYVYSGGVLESFQADEEGVTDQTYSGNIDWVAAKTKFFTQIIKTEHTTDGATVTATQLDDTANDILKHSYSTSVRSRIGGEDLEQQFKMFVGPLEYYRIRNFDRAAYDMVYTGWWAFDWFSSPFVKYAIQPFFHYIGGLASNIGITLILFAIAVKLLLYPLTKKSFESMAAMRELQPELQALQEKYKDDPQKQQQETLKLFKKANVNPLGSCLPMLLQLPVLITFFWFFQNAIELRQESFLWANDMSAPDVILSLPFHIPVLGDHLAGFVLLMAATMVVQMKLSGQSSAGGGQAAMKMMQYIMPVFLLVIFNNFAAGLSLYYLVFNALSIGQQMMINKKVDHVKLMESVDKKRAKELRREKLLEEKEKKKQQREQEKATEE